MKSRQLYFGYFALFPNNYFELVGPSFHSIVNYFNLYIVLNLLVSRKRIDIFTEIELKQYDLKLKLFYPKFALEKPPKQCSI